MGENEKFGHVKAGFFILFSPANKSNFLKEGGLRKIHTAASIYIWKIYTPASIYIWKIHTPASIYIWKIYTPASIYIWKIYTPASIYIWKIYHSLLLLLKI